MASVACIDKPLDTAAAQASPAESAGAWSSPEFGEIYAQHSKPIYYLALRMLADPTQAEDATHDVFLKAFRNMKQFRGESAVRTWLYRIAINHCQNLLQTWHRRTMVNNVEDDFWERSSGGGDSPLRALETSELGERIQQTLDRLPEEYRLLLLLVADQELSYEEIGELTKQSADAVRGKLHRARKAFTIFFQQTE
jgi:RNA polymerase sigma-70 factor (ECF subfamily)